jgi:hypothetical protein
MKQEVRDLRSKAKPCQHVVHAAVVVCRSVGIPSALKEDAGFQSVLDRIKLGSRLIPVSAEIEPVE